MTSSKVLWVLRSSRGQLQGPFDTQLILQMIKSGSLSGHEMIMRYPDGQWISISAEPEFYEQLLEGLQRDDESPIDDEEPSVKNTEVRESSAPKIILEKKPPRPEAPRFRQERQEAPPTIELSNMRKIEKQQQKKVLRKPVLALLGVLVLGGLLVLWPSPESKGRIRLISPKKGEEVFSPEEVKSRLRQALADIQKDTVESYVQAENKLVPLIEGSYRYLPARALLCVVYKELWPYTFQDQQDQKTVTEFSQATKNLNLISIHGNICEAVKLMVLGRMREARGVVDNMLDNPDDVSFLSTVYLIKGELLHNDQDMANAQGFLEKAVEIGRDWLKPKNALAQLHLKTRQYGRAIEIFSQILKINPGHKTAQLGLGTALFELKKKEEAYQWLKSAYDLNALAPWDLEAEGYFIFANLALERGNKSLATEVITRAYDRNPQSEKIKDLLVRLGGGDKTKGADSKKNELIFLGDQYARQGDCFSAQAQYKTAFEIDPKNGTAAMKTAKCLWQLHQSYEAIEWLKKAIKADPQLVSAYVLQADYLSRRYDFFAATQILMSARRIAPQNYEILRGFAQIEFRKNNLEGAINYGQKTLSLFQGDIENLILLSQANIFLAKRILPNNPKDVERRENALKDGMKYALKALEIDGTNVEVNKNYAMIISMTTGQEAGVRLLQELIRKYSFSHEYRVALGDLYRSEQRFNDAQTIYEQVIDADPKNKEAFLGVGDCYRATKDMTKALKAFLAAAALDPSDAQPVFEIGKLHLENQRYDEAVKYFERVNKINPNFPRTFFYIAKAAFSSGAFSYALQMIQQEKKNNPYLSDSYILAAEIHFALSQYNECASEYSQAIKLRPQPAETYVRAAQCYRLGGSTEVAEDMVAIAATRESGNAEIYREQGAIFDTKGDRKASLKAYCLYLELSPNAPDRKKVEARLSELGFSIQNCNNR